MCKILVVEDDFAGRLVIQKMCSIYGEVHTAVNGLEAVDAIRSAYQAEMPYDLICLDVMMPEMDGHTALTTVREMEEKMNISDDIRSKILMTTALDDGQNVMKAFRSQCDGYLVKPIDKEKLKAYIIEFGLFEE